MTLQILVNLVAGNVNRRAVVLHLCIAANGVAVDGEHGAVVVSFKVAADRVAGAGTGIVGADLDRAEIVVDLQIALDLGPQTVLCGSPEESCWIVKLPPIVAPAARLKVLPPEIVTLPPTAALG